MQVVGINNGYEILGQRYQEVLQEPTVNKVTFVYILEEEFNKVGYS